MEQQNLNNIQMNWEAIIEKLQIDLEKVTRNILDVNTDPAAKRTVTLKIAISPNKDRTAGNVVVSCNSTLAADQAYQSLMFFGEMGGQVGLSEKNLKQLDLFEHVKEGKKIEEM